MTRTNLLTKIKVLALAIVANFATMLVTAQERAADFQVEAENQGKGPGSESWYSNPLLLVVGALVLITIVVFVIRGRRR